MMITLKTLAQATDQEVFDQVKTHLLTQNQKAVNNYGKCRYRFGELKCAAGCLIGDDEYRKEFDSYGGSWPFLCNQGLIPKEHMALIVELQRIHDRHNVEWWPASLREVAKKFNLEYK